MLVAADRAVTVEPSAGRECRNRKKHRRGDLRRQDTCVDIVDIVESPSLMSVVVVYPTSPQARMPGWGARRSGPGTARWQRGRR